jgi:cytochrome c oxidase cbb3-type subunit 3
MQELQIYLRRFAAATLVTWSVLAVAQPPAPAGRQIVIANPDATFPAQQRALPKAEVIARGNGLYQVNCQACHGADLRGGDQGGPNLLRSEVVLNDVAGEFIGRIVIEGLNRMPAITMTDDAIEAVAGYIHSVVATAERQGAPPRVEYELNILVGDAGAGRAYFRRECRDCHSDTGDLSGIGSRFADPVDLQNAWVAGRARTPFGAPSAPRRESMATIATVTLPSGHVIEGELVRYDDFFLSLRTADGEYRSFTRRGATPAIRIDDPLWRHYELLAELTDEDMHNVTAYLETIE